MQFLLVDFAMHACIAVSPDYQPDERYSLWTHKLAHTTPSCHCSSLITPVTRATRGVPSVGLLLSSHCCAYTLWCPCGKSAHVDVYTLVSMTQCGKSSHVGFVHPQFIFMLVTWCSPVMHSLSVYLWLNFNVVLANIPGIWFRLTPWEENNL